MRINLMAAVPTYEDLKKLQFINCTNNTSFVLYQGNITFGLDESEGVKVQSNGKGPLVSRLLGVQEEELLNTLTQRVIAARGEVMQKTLDKNQAEYARDALAKVSDHIDFFSNVFNTFTLTHV